LVLLQEFTTMHGHLSVKYVTLLIKPHSLQTWITYAATFTND